MSENETTIQPKMYKITLIGSSKPKYVVGESFVRDQDIIILFEDKARTKERTFLYVDTIKQVEYDEALLVEPEEPSNGKNKNVVLDLSEVSDGNEKFFL